MPKPIPDFLEILKILVSNEVDFIVIGGVCAVLHGAPVTTFDLDLVHSRVPDNLDRLILSLHALDAYYRERDRYTFVTQIVTPLFSRASSNDHVWAIGLTRNN